MNTHSPEIIRLFGNAMPIGTMLHDPGRYLDAHSEEQLRAIAGHFEAKDWSRYVTEQALHNYRIDALYYAMDYGGFKGASYWTTLRRLYTLCSNPGLAMGSLLELFGSDAAPGVESCMDEWELAVFRGLPDEVVAYRGAKPKFRCQMSWTFSPKVAARFAREHGGKVYCARIPKGDVIAYFADNGEEELLVWPDTAKQWIVKPLRFEG